MVYLIRYIQIIFIFTCDQYKNTNETVHIFSYAVISVQTTYTSRAQEPRAVLGTNPHLLPPQPPLSPAQDCRGSCLGPLAPCLSQFLPPAECQPRLQSQGP